jgi:sporulation protein YlmC with PRC-barrel domain
MKTTLIGALSVLFAGIVLAADPPRANIEVRKPATEQAAPQSDVDHAGTVRASEMLGMELVLQDGNSSGKIADLVIDSRSGQISYLVIETDGTFRAIPYKTVTMDGGEQPADRYAVLGVEQSRFLEAPSIPQAEWRTYTPVQWQTYAPTVNEFYTDVRAVTPGQVRRADRAVDRNIRQGDRKANRKLD